MKLRDSALTLYLMLQTAYSVIVTREIRILHARLRKQSKRMRTIEQAEGLTGTEHSVMGVPNINRAQIRQTETWWQKALNRAGKWWRGWRL